MAAKVYAIASGKGGTGKTTITVNLGTALAMCPDYSEKKVVIIDADIGMANLGFILGLEKSPTTLHEVLAGKADVEDAMYKGIGGVTVIPSGISLQGFQNSKPEKLKEVIDTLRETADIILIDTPSGISKESMVPLTIAAEILLVVNPELTSIVDALKTKVLAEGFGVEVGGVIINRADGGRNELSSKKVGELLGTRVLQVIPEDMKIKKAALFRTPVVVATPNSPAAKGFKRLAITLLEENYGKLEKKGFVERLKDLFRFKS